MFNFLLNMRSNELVLRICIYVLYKSVLLHLNRSQESKDYKYKIKQMSVLQSSEESSVIYLPICPRLVCTEGMSGVEWRDEASYGYKRGKGMYDDERVPLKRPKCGHVRIYIYIYIYI